MRSFLATIIPIVFLGCGNSPPDEQVVHVETDVPIDQGKGTGRAGGGGGGEGCGGDPVETCALLDDFVASTTADLAALEHARSAGALAEVTREAHKIKGAARLVGAMELGAAADRLEAAGRAEDWSAVGPLAADIATAAQRLALYVAARWPRG